MLPQVPTNSRTVLLRTQDHAVSWQWKKSNYAVKYVTLLFVFKMKLVLSHSTIFQRQRPPGGMVCPAKAWVTMRVALRFDYLPAVREGSRFTSCSRNRRVLGLKRVLLQGCPRRCLCKRPSVLYMCSCAQALSARPCFHTQTGAEVTRGVVKKGHPSNFS